MLTLRGCVGSGGYYINIALIATLLSGVSIGLLVETDLSEATLQQRVTLGASGVVSFGFFIATAADCVLVDNSTRKLCSHAHVFVYLAHSQMLLAMVMRLFYIAFVCVQVQVVAMVNILYVEATWPVVGLCVLMTLMLSRRFLLAETEMAAFSAHEDEEIDALAATVDQDALARAVDRRLARAMTMHGLRGPRGMALRSARSFGTIRSMRLWGRPRVNPLRNNVALGMGS